MTALFKTGPDAPFIQRAAIPGPGRSSRRRLAFGFMKGPHAGVRAALDVAVPLRDLLAEGRRERLADDELLAETAAALREVPGEETARNTGREAWHARQQREEDRP